MAISDQNDESKSFLLDSLYCEEEEVGVESLEEEEEEISDKDHNFIINGARKTTPSSLVPLLLLEQDLFWEDEELLSLFSKEKQTHLYCDNKETEYYSVLCVARGEAVEWMLKVKTYYGFSALTAVLSINFFDRFLSSLHFQKDKPWMIQLAAVTCLSLAAKVEETQVPLLLDLQVEDSKYVFEAKTIQRMELLVMSTLQWRMNPVTPLSFLDHIIRRLGLKSDLHWEFFKKCEALLLSVVADSRSIRYLPSVLATATMLHVIHQVEPFNAIQYQNQLLGVLKTNKEEINECYELIGNISNTFCKKSHKRKYEEEIQIPGSPSGVIDASFSSDSSNDSWGLGSSACSSPEPPLFKKIRIHEEKLQMQMQRQMPSSFKRVFVDVGSPASSVS